MTQTTETAKQQAAEVGQSAAGATQNVAATAKDEASNVVQEAANQARDVVGTARDQLTQQVAEQQERAAKGLRSLSRELGTMADGSEDPGYASDLARQAASTVDDVAGWLENRDGSGLLDDVKSFARRRPGAFIALAVGAGVVAGRLTRGLKDDSSGGSSSPSGLSSTPAPAPSVTPSPYAGSGTGAFDAPYDASYDRGYDTAPAADPYPPVPATDEVIVSPAYGQDTGQERRP